MNRRFAIASLLASAGVVLAPRIGRGQAGFPNRPIRIIVPVSPGGGVDTFARLILAGGRCTFIFSVTGSAKKSMARWRVVSIKS